MDAAQAKEGAPKRRPGSGVRRPAAPAGRPAVRFGGYIDPPGAERKVIGNLIIFFFLGATYVYEPRHIELASGGCIVGYQAIRSALRCSVVCSGTEDLKSSA